MAADVVAVLGVSWLAQQTGVRRRAYYCVEDDHKQPLLLRSVFYLAFENSTQCVSLALAAS